MSNEDYIKEYPHLFKDDIDKWLFTECSIMGGACSSIESLRYSVARGVAEKLWRDDAPRKPIKVYRVENEAEEKGLWRKFDGTWEPLFDMLTDGKCKDMPMEFSPLYSEGGKAWFASAPSKETLQEWFSRRDLVELLNAGFTISEFIVTNYKKVSDYEYIFTRDSILCRSYLGVEDIYPTDFVGKSIEFWTGCIEDCMSRYMETWNPEMKEKTIENFRKFLEKDDAG